MTDDEMRDIFQAMQDEPVPLDSLIRVRNVVAARTLGRSWPVSLRLAWKIAIAVAALASVILVFSVDRTSRPAHSPTPRVVVHEKQVPPRATVPVVKSPLPPTRVARAAPPTEQPAPKTALRTERKSSSGEGLLIRIETPDPDVVILLVGDRADL